MTPSFYLGMMPTQSVEASLSVGEIFEGATGALAACALESIILLAVGELIVTALESVFAVPTTEVSIPMIGNTLAGAGAEIMNLFKECLLDALAWAAKSIVIEIIMASILEWISEGFDGGPAFLSRYEGFFRDLAFATFDTFINESGLDKLLCEPFKDDITNLINKIDIRVQTKGYKCSTKSIAYDLKKYNKVTQDGDISDIGLTGALSLVNSGNNPIGVLFDIEAEANARVGKATSKQRDLLQMGNGWFSQECSSETESDDESAEEPRVCTPAQFIAQQVNKWMGGGLEQLIVADEVSEIVQSLVSTLVQEVLFDGENGLLREYGKTTPEIHSSWSEKGYDQTKNPNYNETDYTDLGTGREGGGETVVAGISTVNVPNEPINTDEEDTNTATAMPAGTCGKVYDTYGIRGNGRMAWRIPKGGEVYKTLTITFSNGYSVDISDTLKNQEGEDGFLYKPGINNDEEGGESTNTSHGGVYILAPYGNSSTKVRLCN